MAVLVFLFFAGAIAMAWLVLRSYAGTTIIPSACPVCRTVWISDVIGRSDVWYEVSQDGHVQCQGCYAWFRETSNGTLIREPF